MTIDELINNYDYMLPFSEGLIAITENNCLQYSTLPMATLVQLIDKYRDNFNINELEYMADLLSNRDTSNLLMCKALIESKGIR